MPIDPKLLTKAAKVYEAAESVEGGKPKEVYESHKQCTPGEFGMNKEGGMFAKFVRKTAADIMTQRDIDAGVNAEADAQSTPKPAPAPVNKSIFNKMPPRGTGHSQPPKPMPAAPKPAPVNKGIFNKMSAGNEGWKGFDYSKNGPGGLIGSRTLPKTDATAKNWQGTQGTPRKPGSATAPADQKNPPMKPVPQPMMKKISAYKFGSNVLPGAGLGAALGGLYGLAAPGSEEEYDDEGRLIRKQPRSRLSAMLRGALGGGILGGAGGVAADQYAPNASNDAYNFARGLFTGKSKAELTRGDNVAKLNPAGQSVDRQARTIGQRIKTPALRMPPVKPQFGPDRPIDIRLPNESDFDSSANESPMGPGDPHA